MASAHYAETVDSKSLILVVSYAGLRRVIVSERPSPETSKLAMHASFSKHFSTVRQAGDSRSSLANGNIEGGADADPPII